MYMLCPVVVHRVPGRVVVLRTHRTQAVHVAVVNLGLRTHRRLVVRQPRRGRTHSGGYTHTHTHTHTHAHTTATARLGLWHFTSTITTSSALPLPYPAMTNVSGISLNDIKRLCISTLSIFDIHRTYFVLQKKDETFKHHLTSVQMCSTLFWNLFINAKEW